MTTSKTTQENLIEYIDRVNASLLADYEAIKTEVDDIFTYDLSHHDLLWDIAAVRNTMLRLHSDLKQLQVTVRNTKIAS